MAAPTHDLPKPEPPRLGVGGRGVSVDLESLPDPSRSEEPGLMSRERQWVLRLRRSFPSVVLTNHRRRFLAGNVVEELFDQWTNRLRGMRARPERRQHKYPVDEHE